MPTYAAEGYGYLQAGDALDLPYSQAIFAVSRFVEKPSAAKAEAYLEQGGYYWNSGMFFARAAVLLAAIEHCMPELSFGLQKLLPSLNTPEELQALAEYYPALEKCSFDYGVMEHTTQILTVVGDFAWDDVGTWQAVARYWPQEVGQNHWCGSLLPVIIDSRDCFIHCDGRLVAALGVKDLLIVCCDDVVLVADKNRSQEVKRVVEEVRRRGLDLYL